MSQWWLLACLCLAGCGPEAVGSIDAGTPSSDMATADAGPAPVTDVGLPHQQDATLDAVEDHGDELSPVSDAMEVLETDLEAPDVALEDLGPPPLEAAPDWFHQVKLEGVATDEDGESEQFFVSLPEGTTSVFLQVESEEDYAFYTLKTVVTPKPMSQIIVKGAGDATCIPCLNRVSAAQKVAAFLLPNDPSILVGGGDWLFRLRSTGVLKLAGDVISYPPVSSVSDVTILARTEPVPEVGSLRLHLHFTGAGGLNAENAMASDRLSTALEVMAQILGDAGIEVVVAGVHDVPGTEEDPTLVFLESTIGNPNDLSKLLLSGQGEDVSALNVFFVGSIYKDGDFSGGGLVLGMAAGVPGPAFIGPSYRSGVAVALFEEGEGEDYVGNVLAHEVGHYLGLYHSTEKNGTTHDTLSDTEDDHASNLMFWAYSPAQKELSSDQGYVIRSHPLVLPASDDALGDAP